MLFTGYDVFTCRIVRVSFCSKPDPARLRGLEQQAAKPNWTEKDLNNVVEKLSKAQA